MSSGFRFILLGCLSALALSLPAAAASGSGDATQIVGASHSNFVTETLDGTVTGTVAMAPGTAPDGFSAAADGSIAYDDINARPADSSKGGPVWIVGPGLTPVELDSNPYDFDASISADGSRVLFARWDPATNSSDIYVVDGDGSNLTLVASGEGDNLLLSPLFSPDGSSIAYSCSPAWEGPSTSLGCGPTLEGTYLSEGVMLMNADGSDRRMIVAGGPGSLAWSPDGKSLAAIDCSTVVQGNLWSCSPWQIFVFHTDGSDLFSDGDPSLQVTHYASPSGLLGSQFSPDGAQILFERVVDNQWEIFSIDRDGSNEQAIAPGKGTFAVVPPATGGGPPATVAAVASSGPGFGSVLVRSWLAQCHGFMVIGSTGAVEKCVSIPTGAFAPTYAVAADGSVAFVNSDDGAAGDQGPLWLARPGQAAVELDSSQYDFDPAISADGSKLAFARWDPTTDTSDLYTVDADGTGLKLVASGQGLDQLLGPSFSPDGGTIAYTCSAGGGQGCGPTVDGAYFADGVMLMNVDGSDKRMVVDGAHGPVSWSPDGKWLALAHCVAQVAGSVYSCGPRQIFRYRTDGSDLLNVDDPDRQVTHERTVPQGAFLPQFSPDGTQVVFGKSIDDAGDQGNFLYSIGVDGTNEQAVTVTPDPQACSGGLCLARPEPWGQVVPPATGGGPGTAVSPTRATVPLVRALRYQTAKKRLDQRALTATVSSRTYSASVPAGRVISQSPRAYAHAQLTKQQGRVVKLVVSRGVAPVLLTIRRAGTGAGMVSSTPKGVSCGSTCRHGFARSTRVTLTATPSSGSTFAGWSGACSGAGSCTVTMSKARSVTATFDRVRISCVVPKVKGKVLKAAKRAIVAHHCGVGKVTRVFSARVKKGHVSAQKPRAGRKLHRGAKVALTVSKGKRPKR